MKIQKNDKFLLIGDSVTDAGRNRPVAEGLFNPHGTGYPNVVQGLLTSVYPDYMIRVVNMGCSGNTVRDLKARWQADVLDLRPDWVSVMIGINDIWRQFDVPQIPEAHVLEPEYEQTLEALGAMVRRYGAICRKLAERHGAIFADAQAYADAMLRHCHPAYVSWDRVHPNIPGHNVLAHALLDAIGFDFNRKA